MEVQKPTTITTPTGTELTKTTDAQGNVISDGANDRILIGYQKSGFGTKDFGIKVSQNGYDVKTATDSQLVMSSEFNMFKIVSSGTATTPAIASKGASSSITVTHNLGFVPLIVAFANYASGYTPLPVIAIDNSAGTIQQFIDIEFASSSSFQIWAYNSLVSSSTTMAATSIKYYLLQETAN